MLLLTCTALALAGCNESSGVVMATPVPVGGDFQPYAHPSGVFWLRLPVDWAVNDLSTGDTLLVEFSPPGAVRPPLVVHALNTGAPMTVESFERAIADYQNTYYGDATVYQPQPRVVQADGSWLIPALHQTIAETLQLNTFFERAGPFFIALEVVVPAGDPALLETLDAVIDTFGVDRDARIEADAAGEVLPAGAPQEPFAAGVVGFRGLFTWTDAQGAFIINGQVVNNDVASLTFVQITADLLDAAGGLLAEESDFATADVIAPGQTAYFTVRFPDGRPAEAAQYELHANARHVLPAAESFYGPEHFTLEYAADYKDGYLTVDGTVTNNGDVPAYYVKVTAIVFDDLGRVVAVETTFGEKRDLGPGESTPYQVTFFELGGQAVSHTATVQGSLEP
jgi:hypothetical protein